MQYTNVSVSVLLIKIISQEMSHVVVLGTEIIIPFHQVSSGEQNIFIFRQ